MTNTATNLSKFLLLKQPQFDDIIATSPLTENSIYNIPEANEEFASFFFPYYQQYTSPMGRLPHKPVDQETKTLAPFRTYICPATTQFPLHVKIHLIKHGMWKGRKGPSGAVDKEAFVGLTQCQCCFSPQRPLSSVHFWTWESDKILKIKAAWLMVPVSDMAWWTRDCLEDPGCNPTCEGRTILPCRCEGCCIQYIELLVDVTGPMFPLNVHFEEEDTPKQGTYLTVPSNSSIPTSFTSWVWCWTRKSISSLGRVTALAVIKVVSKLDAEPTEDNQNIMPKTFVLLIWLYAHLCWGYLSLKIQYHVCCRIALHCFFY